VFFLNNTYLQLLVKVAAFAAANPELFRKLWVSLVASYNASMEFASRVSEAIGGEPETVEGTLQLVEASDEETEAEERLAAIIYPEGTQALREAGSIRKLLAWAASTEAGRKWLAKVLAQLGS
jgi:hypothetical protein